MHARTHLYLSTLTYNLCSLYLFVCTSLGYLAEIHIFVATIIPCILSYVAIFELCRKYMYFYTCLYIPVYVFLTEFNVFVNLLKFTSKTERIDKTINVSFPSEKRTSRIADEIS